MFMVHDLIYSSQIEFDNIEKLLESFLKSYSYWSYISVGIRDRCGKTCNFSINFAKRNTVFPEYPRRIFHTEFHFMLQSSETKYFLKFL